LLHFAEVFEDVNFFFGEFPGDKADRYVKGYTEAINDV
jgi:hypothetical protein